MEVMQKPATPGSKPACRVLKPARTPTFSVSADFTLIYQVAMDFTVAGQAPLPPPRCRGLESGSAPAQGCSHESLYWQIFINFNAINLLSNKNPRWHLQRNRFWGRQHQGGDLLLCWGRGVYIFLPFQSPISDSRPSEKAPWKPWIFSYNLPFCLAPKQIQQ